MIYKSNLNKVICMQGKLQIKIFLLIVPIILFSLFYLGGCSFDDDKKMKGMPKYDSSECYYSEGFQDYTDYCKYYYNKTSIKEFENHNKFKKVTEQDIKNIKSYLENFTKWVENQKYYEHYDFDLSQIKAGDYCYINDKEGKPIGQSTYQKYENYDLYYVDMEKNILYFIHNNI